MIGRATAVLAIAVLLAGATAATGAPAATGAARTAEAHGESSVTNHAAATLLQALETRYTQVTRWDVQPLGRSDREGARDAEAQLRVLQLGPRSAVRLRSRDDRGALHQRTLWFAVQGMQQVLTAERGLAAGAALESRAVMLRERDVLAANCEPLAQASNLEQLRTRVAVRAGAVLCARDVEPRPPVARGEAVIVRYVGPTVALTTRGVAQSDAQIGREVAIRNPSSREEFLAVVSAPGEVTIHD